MCVCAKIHKYVIITDVVTIVSLICLHMNNNTVLLLVWLVINVNNVTFSSQKLELNDVINEYRGVHVCWYVSTRCDH